MKTILIGNPFDAEYRTSSAELILTYVEASGQRVEIRFDPHATRALCDLLGQAIQINRGPLGLPVEPIPKH